jgi:hypothetical protein
MAGDLEPASHQDVDEALACASQYSGRKTDLLRAGSQELEPPHPLV